MSTPLNMSHRNFLVIIIDQGTIPLGNDKPFMKNVSIERLLSSNGDYEYMYAMHEELDAILDLKNGESMYFQPNRDDKRSKGIITRNDKINER